MWFRLIAADVVEDLQEFRFKFAAIATLAEDVAEDAVDSLIANVDSVLS